MRSARGFTIMELIIAILIGSILTSIAMSSFGTARGGFAVRGARNTFVSLQARARAQAIESGAAVWMLVDVVGDSVVLRNSTSTLETFHFDDEMHVDLRSSSGSFRLCMNSRGYGETSCNSFSTRVKLTFEQNADSTSVEILPLGQLVY